jgi:uncharacterized SAM-binding protein YcdF (DUF218 family)
MQHDTYRKFDVVIVLGAAVCAGGKPSPILVDRVRHAVTVFKAGRADKVIVTGGLGRHPPPEAHLMRDLAVAGGIPERYVIVEDHARNTFESAAFCSKIMHGQGWSTALIVSDAYHLPRSVFTFRRFGVSAIGSATPRRANASGGLKWLYLCLREMAAVPWYLLRLATAGYLRHRSPAQN